MSANKPNNNHQNSVHMISLLFATLLTCIAIIYIFATPDSSSTPNSSNSTYKSYSPTELLNKAKRAKEAVTSNRINNAIGVSNAYDNCKVAKSEYDTIKHQLTGTDTTTQEADDLYRQTIQFCEMVITPLMFKATF